MLSFEAFASAVPKPSNRTSWKGVVESLKLVEGTPVPLPHSDSCKQFPILRKSVVGAGAKLGLTLELAKIDGVVYVCRMPSGGTQVLPSKAAQVLPSKAAQVLPRAAEQAASKPSKPSKAPSMPKPFDA
jgi:hypothetical protein